MFCARLAAAVVVELLLAVTGMVRMCCRVECWVASYNCCAAVRPASALPCSSRPPLCAMHLQTKGSPGHPPKAASDITTAEFNSIFSELVQELQDRKVDAGLRRKQHFIICLDHATVHNEAATLLPQGWQLLSHPPHSPECNKPIEHVHGQMDEKYVYCNCGNTKAWLHILSTAACSLRLALQLSATPTRFIPQPLIVGSCRQKTGKI